MQIAHAHTPRWERRKESRPAELLAAALDIFVERGFAATRLDEVARRAGVSKGTLYLYFENKEELFKAVVREAIVPLIQDYRRDFENSEASSLELLPRFFREWWRHFGSTPLAGIAKLIIGEAGNFPELARFFFAEVIQPNDALLCAIVERGIARGEFASIDVEASIRVWMAPLVLKAISAHSLDAICAGDELIDPERFLRAHTDFVMSALRPRAAGPGPRQGPGGKRDRSDQPGRAGEPDQGKTRAPR